MIWIKHIIKMIFYKSLGNILAISLGYHDSPKNPSALQSHYYEDVNRTTNLVAIHDHFLKQSGWLETKKLNSSSVQGEFIPWMTFPFINFIKRFDLRNCKVLEFGGGASTIFFAKRANNVVTVEKSHEFLEQIKLISKEQNLTNLTVLTFKDESDMTSLIKESETCEEIKLLQDLMSRSKKFFSADMQSFRDFKFSHSEVVKTCKFHFNKADLVIIDAEPRRTLICLAALLLNDHQILVVDNSDAASLQDAVLKLKESGFQEIPFLGLGPMNPYEWTTSIFFRSYNAIADLTNVFDKG